MRLPKHWLRLVCAVSMCVGLTIVIPVQSSAQDATEDGPTGEAPPPDSEPGIQRLLLDAGATSFDTDEDGTGVYKVEDGFDLDQYLYRSSSPISFSIDVDRNFGPVDEDGHPVEGNQLFGKVGRISLRTWDVDRDYTGSDVAPEIDLLHINGNEAGPEMAGANDHWSINTLMFPLEWLKLPTEANPTGTNDFELHVDTANTGPDEWAVTVDWAELRLSTGVTPLVMAHGLGDSPGRFGDLEEHFAGRVDGLDGRILRPQLDDGRGSIAHNAGLLHDVLEPYMEATGAHRIRALGHSKGGLDLRQYAWDHPGTLDRLLMLGTPNGGSLLADIACSTQSIWTLLASGIFGPLSPSLVLIAQQVIRNEFGHCGGPDDALYQMQRSYVQDVFNQQVQDRYGTTYRTIAGTSDGGGFEGNILGAILPDPNDGIVPVSSVQYLDADPDLGSVSGGRHRSYAVVDDDHLGLTQDTSPAADLSVCALYVLGCPFIPSGQGSEAQPLELVENGDAGALGWVDVRSVSALDEVAVPLSFGAATTASIIVLGDDVEASFGSETLQEFELLGGTVLGVVLDHPEDGTLQLENLSDTATDAVVLTLVKTDRRLNIEATPTLVQVDEQATIAIELTEHAAGDEPVLAISDVDEMVVAEPPLTSTGSGTWQATFTPAEPGEYMILAGVDGDEPRLATTLLSVGDGSAALTGTFTDVVEDTNGNGLNDALVVSVDADIDDAGTYRLAGRLVSGSGELVASVGTMTTLSAGSTSIDLRFEGADVYESGVDGPYHVVDVVLSSQDMALIDKIDDLGSTSAYDRDDFEHLPVAIDSAGFSDEAVDIDDDGVFDRLDVHGIVDVDTGGSYAVNARLMTDDGTELDLYDAFVTLAPGNNGLTLQFDWHEIRAHGIDGPWHVQDLSIYPTADADALGYLVHAHTTAPYDATGGAGFDLSWFTQPDEDISGDLDGSFEDVAELPFSTDTEQTVTLSGGIMSGSHTWGLPDMSEAPGPARGFRALMQLRVSGGTGVLADVSVMDGDTEVSTHPQVLLTDDLWKTYAFHFPDGDFATTDLDDLRLRFDFARPVGGDNLHVWVSGVAFSKSPITDEAGGTGPLDGAEVAAYRASDLVALGGQDNDDVVVWPDATGRGQHLVWAAGDAPRLGVDGSDVWVESDTGRIAGVLDEPVEGFARMIEFRPDALTSPPLPVAAAEYMSTASEYAHRWDTAYPAQPDESLWDKNLLGHRTTPPRTAIMHSDGTQPSISDGTVDLVDGQWYQHTGYVPTTGDALAWLGDADDPENTVTPVGPANRLQRMSFFDRDTDDRPADGAIRNMYFYDMGGFDIDDLDAARDAWVNGS